MENKPLLIFGGVRSGTSITTKIIQDHIGEFPFEVNRHYEPVELVEIEQRFMERNGKEWIDRLYFPDVRPDIELIEDLLSFYKKYSDKACVIKSPIVSLFLRWIALHEMFTSIFVYRGVGDVAESLEYHKKFDFEKAKTIANWQYDLIYKMRTSSKQKQVFFSSHDGFYKDTKMMQYRRHLCDVVESVGLKWNAEHFDSNFDFKQIQYYKNDEQ